MDAENGERSSSAGASKPGSASSSSLPEAIEHLVQALQQQTELVTEILKQNATLIAVLADVGDEEDEDGPRDLAGELIRLR